MLCLLFLENSFLEELDSSPAPSSGDNGTATVSAGCSASSLATMAWSLSHTKHKRKFVEANRDSLLRLAAECKGRQVSPVINRLHLVMALRLCAFPRCPSLSGLRLP